MKHFRDLVLSTREPAVKNVLWIMPDKDDRTKYWVYMYEDGWKKLFGGAGSSSEGILYRVDDKYRLPDGPNGEKNVVVQFYDPNANPNVDTNLYPKTKASFVFMSNGISVETAINNINNALSNFNSGIKKAIFIASDIIESESNKTGKTYWVKTGGSTNGLIPGENYLRVYTSNSSYNRTQLALGDILVDINSALSEADYASRATCVASISSTTAIVSPFESVYDILALRTSLRSTYILDVYVDGDSVVEQSGSGNTLKRKAYINQDIREVYMMNNAADIETNFPGNQKKDKTFFYKSGTTGYLIKYTGSSSYIPLEATLGDLFYNVCTNSVYTPNSHYVLKAGTYNDGEYANVNVTLLPDYNSMSTLMSSMIEEGISESNDVYINFTASDENTSGLTTTWTLTNESEYDISDIETFAIVGRTVYARVSGINNLETRNIPTFIPLTIASDGKIRFGISNELYNYYIEGDELVGWQMTKYAMQSRITFDNTPTLNSNNAVTSGGVYNALADKADASSLSDYVLLSTYNDRMAVTPKFHRTEFLDATGENEEYDVWTGDANNGTGVITDSSTHAESARGCFESLWWAVYENNVNYLDAGVPKLIVRRGNVACYCLSDLMSSTSQYSTATQITLKFFDGTSIITYELVSTNLNVNYPNQTVIEVTKTTQAI